MAPTADPATVRGLPESTLTPEHLATLPTRVPAGPWECRARAVIWLQRATTPSFDWLGRPAPLALVGFVEYLDSPVGTYREVLAGSLLRTGAAVRIQVPFIAVDSLASVAGGRVNWALPKTMADFDADLGAATAHAHGDGWSISVRPARGDRRPSRSPSAGARIPGSTATTGSTATAGSTGSRPEPPLRLLLPIRSWFSAISPLGSYRTTLRAKGRLVRVSTHVEGETLTGWLGSGTHLAVALNGRMRINAPLRSR